MNNDNKNKDIVNNLLTKGILVSPDSKKYFSKIGEHDEEITNLNTKGFLYLNKDIIHGLDGNFLEDINWQEFEKSKFLAESSNGLRSYNQFLEFLKNGKKEILPEGLKIVNSYEEVSIKREVKDFAMHFNSRLESLQKMLFSRGQLKGMTSISRVLGKKERESMSVIGFVREKRMTKNNNIMLTIEDATGEIKVLINKNKPDMYEETKDIVLDEVIGVSGVNGDNIIFANNVLWPDVPNLNELKKCDEEAYALFLSDIHIGSNNFLIEDFERFLKWINGKTGNEKQKEIASKVKYIFIIGDLVDGVGIYPGQEDELTIEDIYEQYDKCAQLLSRIPSDIQIIVCGGNHDALRMAEPQPPFYTDFCEKLCAMPNVTTVSNPATVNIHSSEDFPGYNVLLYHGYSFDYYIANVDSIRNNGGYDRADLIMKFLLKRRHLAPTHTSSLYVPYSDKDPLVIDPIPDFFATGHIHKTSVANYKNITLISGSCWQSKTAFQAKMGHHPEPSRVPVVNLATRDVKVLRFGK